MKQLEKLPKDSARSGVWPRNYLPLHRVCSASEHFLTPIQHQLPGGGGEFLHLEWVHVILSKEATAAA